MTYQNKENSQQSKIDRILYMIRNVNFHWVTTFPLVLFFVIFGGGLSIVNILFHGDVPGIYIGIFVSIASFIGGLSGWAQIIRREALGKILGLPIRGVGAIFYGIGWVIFFWSFTILGIYAIYMEIVLSTQLPAR